MDLSQQQHVVARMGVKDIAVHLGAQTVWNVVYPLKVVYTTSLWYITGLLPRLRLLQRQVCLAALANY